MRIFDPVAGGEALLVLDVGSDGVGAGGLRADPASRARRLPAAAGKVFDPIAGGEALLVLDVGAIECAGALADPATGAPRLAHASANEGAGLRLDSRGSSRYSC